MSNLRYCPFFISVDPPQQRSEQGGLNRRDPAHTLGFQAWPIQHDAIPAYLYLVAILITHPTVHRGTRCNLQTHLQPTHSNAFKPPATLPYTCRASLYQIMDHIPIYPILFLII